jgi:tRNA G18 (ribose-2'-O)-methylase SpoU
MSRGYCGIGIYAGKTPENLGGLWRSAFAFGADYIFTIGARYQRRQQTDTSDATKHVPLFEFDNWTQFMAHGCPRNVEIVGIEIDDRAKPLPTFSHPERAAYVLGAEDKGLPGDAMRKCDRLVYVPTTQCLNVATTGSIVLYDRSMKP